MKKIVLAGGCFWGVQGYFKTIKGVRFTSVGYANSKIINPTYELVKTGNTNAVEAVEVYFDEAVISLKEIILKLLKVIDPTALNFQGPDRGHQYRSGIYYELEEDKKIALKTLAEYQEELEDKIVTEVLPLKNYFLAEEYHQDYTDKHKNVACHIKF